MSGALQFLFDAPKILRVGCRRHGHVPFKIADFVRWNVVITAPHLLEELKYAPDDKISLVDTHVCPGLSTNRAHSALLSTKLARTLPVVFPEMREELVMALADIIKNACSLPSEPSDPAQDQEWSSLLVVDAMTEVVSRVCNRAILGPQLCRSTELTALSKLYIRSTGLRSAMHAIFPTSWLTTVMNIFSRVPWRARRIRKSLERIILERETKLNKQRPEEAPHDVLSLSISDSSNPRAIATALLVLNLQSVPSCALTLTNALYHLAARNTNTISTMRKDIEEVVREEGWTLRALERMVTVDSFLKETMRLSGLHAPLHTVTMRRMTLTPYTLSDGTYLPAGTSLSAACSPADLEPSSFDALRFLPETGGTGPRYQLTTASPDFLAWGFGRGACPGRFVAGAVMKMVLAQVVVGFDVRWEVEGKGEQWMGAEGVPDFGGRVLVRKRAR
ncbi:hypothetical protein C0991_009245 [Blastosporella zonata]|nr:hypothetical protein C0991_009245 [Blastosporella zonata]